MLGDVILLPSHPPSTLPATPNISKASNVQAPPSHELLARLAFSAAMARMTKLGVYEERMDEFSEGTAGIPALLEQGSQAPVKKNDIVMRMGKLHAIRQKINLEDENLLDEPEFLWEDARLHSKEFFRVPQASKRPFFLTLSDCPHFQTFTHHSAKLWSSTVVWSRPIFPSSSRSSLITLTGFALQDIE